MLIILYRHMADSMSWNLALPLASKDMCKIVFDSGFGIRIAIIEPKTTIDQSLWCIRDFSLVAAIGRHSDTVL